MQSEESVGIPWQSIRWPIWPMWSHVKSIFRWRALWPFLAATWDSSILTWIRQAWEPEHLPGVQGPEIIGSRWREQDKLKTLGLIELLVVKLMSIWDQAQERFYPQVFSWLCSCQLMLESQSMDSQTWNRYGRWTYKKSLPRDVVGVEFENRSAKATKVRCLIRGALQKKITGRKAGWYRSCVMWWAPPREVVSSNLLGSKRPYKKAGLMTCTESLDEFMICELTKESVCSMIPKKVADFSAENIKPASNTAKASWPFSTVSWATITTHRASSMWVPLALAAPMRMPSFGARTIASSTSHWGKDCVEL